MRYALTLAWMIRACLTVAVANLAQHRLRLLVALLGTGVALLLLLLQLAFLEAARTKVTLLYDYFGFDLAVVPETYQFLYSGGTFDRIRLTQARAAAEVEASFSLNVRTTRWVDPRSKQRSSLLLIGLDEPNGFVRNPAIREGLSGLKDSRSVLVDAFAHADYGPLATGTTAMISGQEVVIAGQFQLGLFFYAEGSAIVRNADFVRLAGRSSRDSSVGFLRLAKGVDPAAAKAKLAAALPRDVRVYQRDELIAQEREFFLTTRPIGIMLRIGMVIAFLVGAVILLQVLSTEIVNRIKEFATLKAIGFGPWFVYGVGLAQTALLALGAFLPAALAGAAILRLVRDKTHLPTGLTPSLGVVVLAIALGMCLAAGIVVLRRVQRADPAELY